MTQDIGPIGSGGAVSGTRAAGGARAIDPEKLKVAQQFEAIFLRQMIGSMRSSGLAEGMFDSSASDQFRDMADARTADEMSKTGSFGIADLLIRQFGWDKPAASPQAALRGIAAIEGDNAAMAATTAKGKTP